jgi:hypothetical protein
MEPRISTSSTPLVQQMAIFLPLSSLGSEADRKEMMKLVQLAISSERARLRWKAGDGDMVLPGQRPHWGLMLDYGACSWGRSWLLDTGVFSELGEPSNEDDSTVLAREGKEGYVERNGKVGTRSKCLIYPISRPRNRPLSSPFHGKTVET